MIEKPLVILGSARSDGNTRKAISLIFSNPSEYTLCDLGHQSIQPYNYEIEPTDDFLKVIDLVLQHNTIIFATPVYWYAMSGSMKAFFDRFTDLISRHKGLGRKLAGKHTFLIATGSDAELPDGFEVPFKRTSEYFDMRFVAGLYLVARSGEIIHAPSQMHSFLSDLFPN